MAVPGGRGSGAVRRRAPARPRPGLSTPPPPHPHPHPPNPDLTNHRRCSLDNLDYDDGSYGPVLVRLAWHASGTYNKADGTGGSNHATMRFDPEAAHGANAGLRTARDLLEPIKAKYPGLSYGDLWTIAGIAAVQEAGGPAIPWRPGRTDGTAANCTPDGRLPDAAQTQDHIRAIFYRMGFNDREIVALAGAHALGRCHTDRSGFAGPWTRAPTTFSNDYFARLVEEKWVPKTTHKDPKTGAVVPWTGPKQFVDAATGDLMMLPADLAFIQDPGFATWAKLYAKDKAAFYSDFAAAYGKLLELGVPFKPEAKVYTFKA
jgi:cytochrome c peroxidase